VIFTSNTSSRHFIFCEQNNFPVFFHPCYSDFLETQGSSLFLAYSERTGAYLPFKLWDSRFLRLITCLYQPLKQGEPLSEDDEKLFFNDFIAKVKKLRLADRITAPYNTAVFQTMPDRSVSAPFGTYKTPLYPLSFEQVFSKFQPRYRTAIRQAENGKVELKYGEAALNDFYALHKLTMDRSGMHVQPLSYFEAHLSRMKSNVLLCAAYIESEPVGAILLVYSRHSAQYLYGSSSDNTKAQGAIKWLHSHAMKLLIEKGVKEYDFVGARLTRLTDSRLKGIQEFKSRFGSILYKGVIWKKDISHFKCSMYDRILKVKIKLSGHEFPMDIIDQELLKMKETNSYEKGKNSSLPRSMARSLSRGLKKQNTAKELAKDLKEAGINAGDTIFVHASLSRIGNVKGGAVGVILSLQEAVGEQGNIVMPAFSYLNTMLETAKSQEYIFSPEKNPSVVGIISETFRKSPNVSRSLHPTHSVCAHGPKARNITEGHHKAETNFGMGTPFGKMLDMNGKLVGLGIGIGPVTFYHVAEDLSLNDNPEVYLPEPFEMKINTARETLIKKVFVHNPLFHSVRIDKDAKIEAWFRKHLKEKNILHESKFGNGMMWWMNVNELIAELNELKKKNINIYKIPADHKKNTSDV